MKQSPNPQLLAEVLRNLAELRLGVDLTSAPEAHPGDVTPTTLTTQEKPCPKRTQ